MQIKKLLKYLPITIMTAGIMLATITPALFSQNNSNYSNNQIFNADQAVDETEYTDQLEYIRNDVAKQDGVTDSIASIKLTEGSHFGRSSAALVIKTDGSTLLYMWGWNEYGELGFTANTTPNPTPTLVTALWGQKITQIALGGTHSAALVTKTDGSTLLYMWGRNQYGQLGNGSTTDTSTPTLVTALSGKIVTQLALGMIHSAALLEDGSLFMWGLNDYGQLGFTWNFDPNPTPTLVDSTPFGSKKITQIAFGGQHSAALLDDGSLYTWGFNRYGQLGFNNGDWEADNPTPTPVTALSGQKITQIVLGKDHSAAILEDGSLHTWGRNNFGQLGNETNVGTNYPNPTPTKVIGLGSGKITQIALGAYHSAAIVTRTDGSTLLYMWGSNRYGQLGNTTNSGTLEPNPTPNTVPALSGQKITQIRLAEQHSAALLADGSLYMWGLNDYGQLGNETNVGKTTPNPTPKKVEFDLSETNTKTKITAITTSAYPMVIDKWLSYVTVDEEISRAKLEEFLSLVEVPNDAEFTINILNQDNKTGVINFVIVTSKFIDINGVEQNTPFPFSITLNLTPRITKMNAITTGYPSDLTSTALKAKLFDNNGLVKDLNELNKYLTIVTPVAGAQYYLVDNKWDANGGDGTVKFAIYASKYYDSNAIEQTGSSTNIDSQVKFVLNLQQEASAVAIKATMPNVRVDRFVTYVKDNGSTVVRSKLEEFFDLTNIPSDAEFTIGTPTYSAWDGNFSRNKVTFNLSISKFNQGTPVVPSTYDEDFTLTLEAQHQATLITAKSTYDQTVRVDAVTAQLNSLTGKALENYLSNFLDMKSIPTSAVITVANVTPVSETGRLTFDVIPTQIYNVDSDIVTPTTGQFSFALDLGAKIYTPTSIKTLSPSVYPQDITSDQFKQRLKTDGATNTGETYTLSPTNITFLKKFLSIVSVPTDAAYTMVFIAQTYASTTQLSFNVTIDKYFNQDGYYTVDPKTYSNLSLNLMPADAPTNKPATNITTNPNSPMIKAPDDFLNMITGADGAYNLEELAEFVNGLNTIPLDGTIITITQDHVNDDGNAYFKITISSYYDGTSANPVTKDQNFEFSVKTKQIYVFEWWWIMIGAGGAIIIGLSVWLIIKKRKNALGGDGYGDY